MKPLKLVKAARNTPAVLGKMEKAAKEIAELLVDGLELGKVWFSAELWAESYTGSKFISRNDRKYFAADEKKDAAQDEVLVGRSQRPAGLKANLARSARDGGVLLRPYCGHKGKSITSESYRNMPENDFSESVFSQIQAGPQNDDWVFQQDMAFARTAKKTPRGPNLRARRVPIPARSPIT